jgi:hypothetical protein
VIELSVPQCRRLDAGHSSRTFVLNPGPVHVGFVVLQAVKGQGSFSVPAFSPSSTNPMFLKKFLHSYIKDTTILAIYSVFEQHT